MTPTEQLKIMLEASNNKDNGQEPYPTSPLDEVDEMSLDELTTRIDTCLSLRQIPNPADVERLVKYHRGQCEIYNRERALNELQRPRRSKSQSSPSGGLQPLPNKSVNDALDDI